MDGNAVFYHLQASSLLVGIVSVLLVFSPGRVAYPFIVVIAVMTFARPLPGVRNPAFVYCLSVWLLLLAICFQGLCVARLSQVGLCFSRESVVRIEGKVVYDSSFTTNGNFMLKLGLSGCESSTGDVGSAHGLAVAVGKGKAILSCGIRVRLDGRFTEDGLFVYDRLQVLDRSRMNGIREHLILAIEERMLGREPEEALVLGTLLLLGRSEDRQLPLRELAAESGCSHVLALSGMHLGILVGLCSLVFRKGRLASAVTWILVSVFVFVAGPRPSLVRSAIAFTLGRLEQRERTMVCLSLQLLLFPWSAAEIGCCYGYLAVIAMSCLQPWLQAFLSQVYEGFASFASTTFCILLLSAPVQLLGVGYWCPASMVASPLASLLVLVCMVLSILVLVLGRLGFLVCALDRVYALLERVLSFFSRFPKCGWLGYLVLCLSAAAIVGLSALRRHRMARDGFAQPGAIDLESAPNVNFS